MGMNEMLIVDIIIHPKSLKVCTILFISRLLKRQKSEIVDYLLASAFP